MSSASSSSSSSSKRRWPPLYGDHIKVNRGSYSHHGIVSSHPEEPLTVVHYSKRGQAAIREEPFESAFLLDSPLSAVTVVPYDHSEFDPEEVVARARSLIGEASYDLLGNNCEHFASFAITGEYYSAQLETHATSLFNAGTAALVIGTVFMAGSFFLGRKARRPA